MMEVTPKTRALPPDTKNFLIGAAVVIISVFLALLAQVLTGDPHSAEITGEVFIDPND